MSILDLIKQNKAIVDNVMRKQAYNDVLNENDLNVSKSIGDIAQQLGSDVDYIGKAPTQLDKARVGLQQFRNGFNENFNTPYNYTNLEPDTTKTFGNKFGEAVGSTARWLNSPAGHGLIMGGISALSGAHPLDTLKYGLGTAALNQNAKTSDNLYRNQLLNVGYSPEYVNSISGYINDKVFKNYTDADYKSGMKNIYQQNADTRQQEADTDQEFKENKAEIDRAKTFIQAQDYYKIQLEQRFITPEKYKEITESSDYDPYALINLNAIDSVAGQQQSYSKSLKTADDIKTNSQKRGFRAKNKGKNIILIETAPKPTQHSVVDVNYHGQKPNAYNPHPQKRRTTEIGEVVDKFKPTRHEF